MPDSNSVSNNEILTTVKEGDLLHHAEILTLRQISASLQAMTSEMQASRVDMTAVKVDVAVIKERQTQHAELKERVSALETELDKLRDRNSKLDGAYTMMTAAKEFGPWLVSLAILAWGLFSKGHA